MPVMGEMLRTENGKFEDRGTEMKKLASMLAGLAALAAAPAMAADMPVKYVRPAPPPVFSWTGCYIGVHVGAGWQVSNFTGGNVVTDTDPCSRRKRRRLARRRPGRLQCAVADVRHRP